MRALTYFLLSMALALPGGTVAADESTPGTQLTTRQEGMVLVVDGWLETRADRTTAWKVLTDYTRFPEFVPGIVSNQVLSSQNGRKTLMQQGHVVAGQVLMPYQGQLEVSERRNEGLDIVFISGPFKDVQGSWRMTPGKPLKLSYSMRMDLSKVPFPPPLAPTIAQQQVSVWVDAFGREIERRAGK